jgi:lysyl-tRNA synthetase class I
MARDTDPVRIICGWCGARYTVQVSWLDSTVEFGCSCGADLKADMDDLFQVRHDTTNPSITLHPVHE